ncbi:MAG: hypothetical protein R3C32_04845 [Chloroflexota bacterium]
MVAVVLLALIGLVTNLAYYGRLSTELVQPPLDLGPATVLIPVVGGLVIGVMARYGSERIRGHGIPEAMETMYWGQPGRGSPRGAQAGELAVSIGTGWAVQGGGPHHPDGRRGGILIDQSQRLSAAERKTLLVAGAARDDGRVRNAGGRHPAGHRAAAFE